MVLGYILPTVLMSLPAPSIITFGQKQIFMAIWQMFPLWVAILQTILPYLIATFMKSQITGENKLGSLRWLYMTLVVVAGIGQVSTFTLVVTSEWFSNLFTPEFNGVFNPSNVFLPGAITPSTKMPSVGAGAHFLLQYDELIGSTSMVLFATMLYINQCQISKVYSNFTLQVMCGITALILTGPLGFAVACIWARDELIATEPLEGRKKSN